VAHAPGKDCTKDISVYYGASDASAAAAVDRYTFIVADDQNNVLRVYKTNNPSIPVSSYDLSIFLAVDPEHPETDIVGHESSWDKKH
jgi:hypothetical protein